MLLPLPLIQLVPFIGNTLFQLKNLINFSTDNTAIVSTNDTIIINTINENDIVTINSTLIGEGHLQVTQGYLNIGKFNL